MNVLIWIAQFLLAASFVWAGSMKLFLPPEQLAQMWPWTSDNVGLVKFTGVVDLLAGLALVLPGLLRKMPWLTIYAAYGTIALMVGASVFHISRGEGSQIAPNVAFACLAAFIAWGRRRRYYLS